MSLMLLKNRFHLHLILSKALAAGAPPQTPNSEGERLRRLPVLHAELKMVLTQFKNGFHSHPNAPIALVAGAPPQTPPPPSPIARERAFGVCQSDTSS